MSQYDNGAPTDPTEAVAEVINEPEQSKMTYPAVLVMRVPSEQPGSERVEMMEINGIDPLAIPTLLRVAANVKEKQLGIGERR